MVRRALCSVLVATGVAIAPPVRAQQAQLPDQAPPSIAAPGADPIVTDNPTLRARLTRIAQRSPSWRKALDALRVTGRRVFVLTPDQVVVAESLDGDSPAEFDPTIVAAAAPIPAPDDRVEVVLVVVNVELIRDAHRVRRSLPVELDADLDRILVHEVYGHALPYLLAGDMSGRCADPEPGQRPSEACSIRRENVVRRELGLGRRTGYDLGGLALASVR